MLSRKLFHLHFDFEFVPSPTPIFLAIRGFDTPSLTSSLVLKRNEPTPIFFADRKFPFFSCQFLEFALRFLRSRPLRAVRKIGSVKSFCIIHRHINAHRTAE